MKVTVSQKEFSTNVQVSQIGTESLIWDDLTDTWDSYTQSWDSFDDEVFINPNIKVNIS